MYITWKRTINAYFDNFFSILLLPTKLKKLFSNIAFVDENNQRSKVLFITVAIVVSIHTLLRHTSLAVLIVIDNILIKNFCTIQVCSKIYYVRLLKQRPPKTPNTHSFIMTSI